MGSTYSEGKLLGCSDGGKRKDRRPIRPFQLPIPWLILRQGDFNTCSSGPRPAQQEASLPSITTARTPGTPHPFTLLMVSLQTEHPALFAAAGALLGSLQKENRLGAYSYWSERLSGIPIDLYAPCGKRFQGRRNGLIFQNADSLEFMIRKHMVSARESCCGKPMPWELEILL